MPVSIFRWYRDAAACTRAAAACTARAAPGVEIVGVRLQSNRPSRSLTLSAPKTRISASHAGRSQHHALLDVRARQQIGARLLERPRHLRRAVP